MVKYLLLIIHKWKKKSNLDVKVYFRKLFKLGMKKAKQLKERQKRKYNYQKYNKLFMNESYSKKLKNPLKKEKICVEIRRQFLVEEFRLW